MLRTLNKNLKHFNFKQFRFFTENNNKPQELMIKLDNANDLKSIVKDSKVPVMVDFYADWCPPCKQLTPVLENHVNTKKNFKLVKVNVDDHNELAEEYGVSGIPHVILYKNGQKQSSFVGFNQAELKKMIDLI